MAFLEDQFSIPPLRTSRAFQFDDRHIETLQEEISAWGNDLNDTQRGVDWQMKIDDARTKLKSVYPKIRL